MRINRKGFMLAEVVVVSVIVCVCLVSLATGISRVSKAYDTRNRYYDVNALYMAEKANLYLIEDDGDININKLISNGDSTKVNNDNLNNIISFYKSDASSTTNIYFSKYSKSNIENLKGAGDKQTYKDFIDYLGGHLDFEGEDKGYEYILVSEICNSENDCYYYGLKVK